HHVVCRVAKQPDDLEIGRAAAACRDASTDWIAAEAEALREGFIHHRHERSALRVRFGELAPRKQRNTERGEEMRADVVDVRVIAWHSLGRTAFDGNPAAPGLAVER